MAEALVTQYPDRVRRVRAHCAGLSPAARARIQHWPGFVGRAVEEGFPWPDAAPSRPTIPAGPLMALVCPEAARDGGPTTGGGERPQFLRLLVL